MKERILFLVLSQLILSPSRTDPTPPDGDQNRTSKRIELTKNSFKESLESKKKFSIIKNIFYFIITLVGEKKIFFFDFSFSLDWKNQFSCAEGKG